jgi:hypothetical protein
MVQGMEEEEVKEEEVKEEEEEEEVKAFVSASVSVSAPWIWIFLRVELELKAEQDSPREYSSPCAKALHPCLSEGNIPFSHGVFFRGRDPKTTVL